VQTSASDSAVLSEDEEDVLNDALDMRRSWRWNSAEKKAEIFPAVHQYGFARTD
jgi:hypothetical protein